MYRQRTAEMENSGEQFVDRLYELPVVHSAIGRLGALYSGTKEHNRLFRFTLQTAESGLGLVVSTARPVVAKFEKPIGTLNGIACQQLEKLEHDYPIITKPTDVVLKQTMETYSSAVKPITDRVKPITDRVGQVTQYGVNKINDVKTSTMDTINGVTSYGVAKVNGVKTYGVNKMAAVTDAGSKQVHRLMENHASRALAEKMDMAINLADDYVDYYLPDDEGCCDGQSAPEKAEVDEASEVRLPYKALRLGRKVRHRAYVNASRRLKAVKLRSLETVDKLNFTVDLMEYARNNFEGAKHKAQYVWEEINKSPEELADGEESEKNVKNLTYERRAIATARHLTQRLKASLAGMNVSVDTIPSTVRAQVDRATGLVHDLYQTFTAKAKTGLTNEDIDAVRRSIAYLRSSLVTIIGYLPFSHFILPEQKSVDSSKAGTEMDYRGALVDGSTKDDEVKRHPATNCENNSEARDYDRDHQERREDLPEHSSGDSCEHNN